MGGRPKPRLAYAGKLLLGAALVLLGIWASVWLLGFLSVFDLFPHSWWAYHFKLVMLAHTMLAAIPFIAIVALLMARIFRFKVILSAFVCVVAATIVSFAGALAEPADVVLSMMRETSPLFLSFLIGVPLLCGVISRRKSTPHAISFQAH